MSLKLKPASTPLFLEHHERVVGVLLRPGIRLRPAGCALACGCLSDPSWARLVRTSAGAVDVVEGLAEVVGEGVGGGDEVLVGLDLRGAVAACGLDGFPD